MLGDRKNQKASQKTGICPYFVLGPVWFSRPVACAGCAFEHLNTNRQGAVFLGSSECRPRHRDELRKHKTHQAEPRPDGWKTNGFVQLHGSGLSVTA